MSTVVTIVAPAHAPLAAGELGPARDALEGLGARTLPADWLAEGQAADIAADGIDPDQAQEAVRAALPGPRDIIAQAAQGRLKRLLVADMDSTIITSETLDEIAAFAGLKDKVAAITARSMNGEIDFATALRERVAMLRGLGIEALEMTWAATRYTDGAATLVATMRAHGAFCALVSGGFTYFTSRVRKTLGFDLDQANVLHDDGARLLGTVAEPILDRDAKLSALSALCAGRGVPLAAACAVGDGANDLAMLRAAGLGVAFRAKPIVAREARARVDHTDLTTLLYAQGYRRAQFAETPAQTPAQTPG